MTTNSNVAAMPPKDQNSAARRSDPLYEIIYSVLRDHLSRGALTSGLVLGEASVARAFQTSRMPASTALKRLCEDGLITGFEGRGYIVSGRRGAAKPRRLDLADGGLELPAQLAEPRRLRDRRDQIYREVEHSVAACLVYGRFQLNESALADHYGVSRTIAHEVLTQLELAGIAVQDRNQRWYAGPLNADDIVGRFQMRWMLEPEALRQSFPHLTEGELIRRRERVHRARKGNIGPPELERIERDLHQDTLAHCHNKMLLDAVVRSQRVLIATHSTFESIQTPSELIKMASEHLQIYDALLERSPDAAAAALEAHLRRALRPNLELLARLDPLPDARRPPYLIPVR